MTRVIIFDFDGVIVESVDIKTQAFADLFMGEGEELVRRVVEYHLFNGGVSRYEKIRHVYAEMLKRPLSEEEFESLCCSFTSLVFQRVAAAPYVPGALEFLQKHQRDSRIYLASATPLDELSRILRVRGIEGMFVRVFGAPTSKDDAVKQVMHETGALPEQMLFVGDALTDYQAAYDNGVPFVARISDNEKIFCGKKCERVRNLIELENLLFGKVENN